MAYSHRAPIGPSLGAPFQLAWAGEAAIARETFPVERQPTPGREYPSPALLGFNELMSFSDSFMSIEFAQLGGTMWYAWPSDEVDGCEATCKITAFT